MPHHETGRARHALALLLGQAAFVDDDYRGRDCRRDDHRRNHLDELDVPLIQCVVPVIAIATRMIIVNRRALSLGDCPDTTIVVVPSNVVCGTRRDRVQCTFALPEASIDSIRAWAPCRMPGARSV